MRCLTLSGQQSQLARYLQTLHCAMLPATPGDWLGSKARSTNTEPTVRCAAAPYDFSVIERVLDVAATPAGSYAVIEHSLDEPTVPCVAAPYDFSVIERVLDVAATPAGSYAVIEHSLDEPTVPCVAAPYDFSVIERVLDEPDPAKRRVFLWCGDGSRKGSCFQAWFQSPAHG